MSLLDTASLVITPNGTKASTLYSVVPSSGAGDMTVTRATTATRVNSAGLIESVASNVPRLDYSNGTCPSILVEPQSTNLVISSSNISTQSTLWNSNQSGITDDNYSISPDGSNNSSLIIPNGVNTFSGVNQSVTLLNQPYQYSIYLKSNSTSATVKLLVIDSNSTFHQIEVNTTNQWLRYGFNFMPSNGSATLYIVSSGSVSWLSWGAQLEAGSYATSYIPTTSASVTRNADVISKTGISSLIGQTEGTLFLDVTAQLNSADEQDFSISDGTVNNRAIIRLASSGVIRGIGVFGGNLEFNIGGSAYTTGTRYKIALSYKNNDVALYVNGTLQGSTSTTTISGTLSRLGFDVFTNGAQIICSPTKAAALWKTRLTNTQLAQLTTI